MNIHSITTKQIVAGLTAAIIVLLVAAKFQIWSSPTFWVIASIVAVAGIYKWAEGGNSFTDPDRSIKPREAMGEIQDYLEEADGETKFWLHDDDEESRKLHKDVVSVTSHGEKERIFAVVGRPRSYNSHEPDYSRSIAVAWSLTKNEFRGSHMELPAKLGPEVRMHPMKAFPKFARDEGRAEAEKEKKSNVVQEFYTNPADREKNRRQETRQGGSRG